jgi:UPF0271 protein
MPFEPDEVESLVRYQVGALEAFCRSAGVDMQHVKPHGALYAMVQQDAQLAQAVADAVAEAGEGIILMLAGKTVADATSTAGVPFVPEGYIDLDYAGDGKLVIERVKQLRDPEATAARAVRLITEGRAPTLDGTELELDVRSICVHGDAPNAPEIAAAVRRALEAAGVELTPLAALR